MDLAIKEDAEKLEQFLLSFPQGEAPVIHHFGPGIYIREMHAPAGHFVLGHCHKTDHLNVMVKGAIAVSDGEGGIKILRAPLIYTSGPGRKFCYVIEDLVWQNIHATEERDIDRLEEMFLDKTPFALNYEAELKALERAGREDDRKDFEESVKTLGLTCEQVSTMSQIEDDLIPFPEGEGKYVVVRESQIHGKGLFLTHPVKAFEVIAPARIKGKRTPAGRYTNHSKNPNAFFVANDEGDLFLVALKDIKGCIGGGIGEEITLDYQQAFKVNMEASLHE